MAEPSGSKSKGKNMAVTSGLKETKVPVFWDFENAWGLEGYEIQDLKGSIQNALKTLDPQYVVEDQVIAVGPAGNAKFRKINGVQNDIETARIPWENLRCEEGVCRAFAVKNPNRKYEQTMRKTDTADKYLIMELFMKVLDNYEDILVISGDSDFLSTIRHLNKRNKFIMLATTDELSETAKSAAKAVWLWRHMIHGRIYIYNKRR